MYNRIIKPVQLIVKKTNRRKRASPYFSTITVTVTFFYWCNSTNSALAGKCMYQLKLLIVC